MDQPQPQMDAADGEGASVSDAEKIARLDSLGLSLAKKRSEAIHARQQSGIETQWIEDEEHYQGIDDQNRNEHGNSWRTKPPGQIQAKPSSATRSTVFIPLTRPYCDAGSARFADMILPDDDRNWAIEPTTLPELVGLAEGKLPPQMRASFAQQPDQAVVAQQVQQAAQQAAQIITTAKEKAKKAADRIEDWQIQSQYHAELRKVIEDSARIGTGVFKGPVPIKTKVVAFENNTLIIKEDIAPASVRVDPWNFYPDGTCGQDIHKGSFTFEKDHFTNRQLGDLKGMPGYIDSQIDLCLEEGPQRAIVETKEATGKLLTEAEDKRFEIWYFYGNLDKEDLTAAGCDCADNTHPSIPAQVTMVNNRVIRATLNPLDSGDFPYDVFPWQRKSGMPWGDGIARQGRTPQRVTNAAYRNMMDNAGLCAGPQIAINQGMLVPADQSWTLTPRKVWYKAEDAEIDDIRKAMTFFEIPSRQAELMEIVHSGMKMMEDATGLPMLLQGQIGSAKGEPLGTVQLANNNAGTVLRRLARTFDDCITEPHIRRYYTWLLQYGEDDEKGDFIINARGSSALVERNMQAQQLGQLLTLSANPIYKKDPAKVMDQFLKGLKFDPSTMDYDDKEWQQLVAKLAQKSDPRTEVAQIMAESKKEIEQARQQFEADQNDKTRNVDLLMKQVDEHIEEMKLTGAQEISFADLKAMLASTVMKLNAQRDLANQTTLVDLHKHHTPAPVLPPPVQTPGRADNGQAFQQT